MIKPIDESKIRHLDPKIKIQWSFSAIVFAIIIWLLATWLASLGFPEGLFGVPPSLYLFMFLMIAGVMLVPYLVWVELKYRNYTYYFANIELIIRRGVLRIERTSIPFEKIQNVNVLRSIFERILGLATIKIETAGSNPNEAEGIIPGVGNYREVVDEILERTEHIRLGSTPQETIPHASAETESITKEITDLRKELRKLRKEKEELINKVESQKPIEFENEKYKKDKKERVNPKSKIDKKE